jgi:hypothetical protein
MVLVFDILYTSIYIGSSRNTYSLPPYLSFSLSNTYLILSLLISHHSYTTHFPPLLFLEPSSSSPCVSVLRTKTTNKLRHRKNDFFDKGCLNCIYSNSINQFRHQNVTQGKGSQQEIKHKFSS